MASHEAIRDEAQDIVFERWRLTFPALLALPPPMRYLDIKSTSPASAARNMFKAPGLPMLGDKQPWLPPPSELATESIDGHFIEIFGEWPSIVIEGSQKLDPKQAKKCLEFEGHQSAIFWRKIASRLNLQVKVLG